MKAMVQDTYGSAEVLELSLDPPMSWVTLARLA